MSNEKYVHQLNPASEPDANDSLLLSSSTQGERRLPAAYYQKALQFYNEPEGQAPSFTREVEHKLVVSSSLTNIAVEGEDIVISLKDSNIAELHLTDDEPYVISFTDLRKAHYRIIVRNSPAGNTRVTFHSSVMLFFMAPQTEAANSNWIMDITCDGATVFVTILGGPYRAAE